MVHRGLIIGVVVALVIIIVGGLAAWQAGYFNLTPAASPSETTTPHPSSLLLTEPSTQERIRDAVMNYVGAVHVETDQFMQDLSWTGGRVDTGLVGAEKYVYTTLKPVLGAAGWTVTIDYPVIPNPTYTLTANYTQEGVQSPYTIVWTGTGSNGFIVQSSFTSNVPVTQEQVRDSVMNYIKATHGETGQFMQDLSWTGGRVDTGLIGAEKYDYTTLKPVPGAAGWTVTLDYPVVLNPIYTLTANYTQSGVQTPYYVVWTGTWQAGTITENSYTTNVPPLVLSTGGTPYW